jgi:hypothetical protein
MRTALLCLVCLTAISCQASQRPTVTHVVICWLKSDHDKSTVQRIVDASEKFRKIPGVVSVTAGRAIPSTRPVVDSSFGVGIVITFKDEEALRAYEVNPIHVNARDQVLRTLVDKLVIYDIRYYPSTRAQEKADAALASPASYAEAEPLAAVTKP